MIKTVIQIAEVGLGLTVALLVGGEVLNLVSLGAFDSFDGILQNFVNLFGYTNAKVFVSLLCAVLVVMAGRWIFSWASNNGGSTPNHN